MEKGLITQVQLSQMSKRDISQLIFLPGFSTAGEVTNVSGRGVGMDVVKTRIEAIGGSVDVTSTLGKGTCLRLTIPLTLAIIPALTIGCSGLRYAVPQISVLELVRLAGEHARGGIELISGAPVYRLRGSLLPLVRLDEQLELVPMHSGDETVAELLAEAEAAGEAETTEDGVQRGGFIVVLQAEQQRFGLVVDDVLDTQEIVVKPLGRHLKGIPIYAGATILGDGSVVLILDATTLARRSNVMANAAGVTQSAQADETEAIDPVLVVELSGGRQAAIPLDMVTRLEEIPLTSIERVGGREVVQYRGHIMPLVRLSGLLGSYADDEGGQSVQLVVYTRGRAERRLRRQPDPRHRDRARRHPQRHRRPRPHRQRRRRRTGRRAARRPGRRAGRGPGLLQRARPPARPRAGRDPVADHVVRGGAGMTQLSTFHVGKYLFGVDVSLVQEIVRLQTITPVPLSGREIAGLINLRGQVFTAVDLRARLGLPRGRLRA